MLTAAGEEFLGYARQVLEQTDLIEERYTGSAPRRHRFSVSTQHYSFAVEAFVDLLKEYGGPEYDFRIRETKTYEIIEDVSRLRSEVGVLYLNGLNGYTICSGVINNELNGPNITAVPLDVDDCMEIGYLLHKRTVPNRFTEAYIDALRRHTGD